jgi:hypothetical protein
MSQIFKISDEERQELNSSLPLIGLNLEKFVSNFYQHFLEKETLEFIQHHSKESLINLFSSALNIIIAHTDGSFPLEETINIFKAQYPGITILIHHKGLFINSFMHAFIETIKENYNDRLGYLWYKAISSFIYFFK